MPARSAVLTLPAEVRDEINRRLIEGAFSGYEALSDWLSGQGYAISKSALHRYGSGLEEEISGAMSDARRANELGRALALDDDGTGLRRTATAMAQETLLRLLVRLRRLEAAAEDDDPPAALAKILAQVTRAMADVGRLGISDSRLQRELMSAAADRAEEVGTRKGLSPDGVAALREAIMGAL